MSIVKTADKKPQVYTDPETGKRKVRMVPVDKNIVKADERKLTPAELKKREKVAKAIERENPNMPMDKKMAIATATAKKESVDEGWRSGGGGHRSPFKAYSSGGSSHSDPFKAARRDAKYKELSHEYEDEKKLARLKQMRKTQQQKKEETVNELSRNTLSSYMTKASDASKHKGLPVKKVDNRYTGVSRASKRLDTKKEEVEIDEAMLNEFSDAQLAQLKKAYANLDRINVTSPTYKKLKAMIANMDVKALEKVARAKVRFVSQIAAREYEKKSGNRLKAKDYMESVDEASYKVPKNYTSMMAKKRRKAGTSEFGTHPDKKKEVKKEEVELDEAIDFRKAHQEIMAYAKKNGGMDKTDFEKVAYYVKAIGDHQNTPNVANKAFMLMKKHIAGLDTDVRDGIHMLLKKHGMIKNGRIVQESIELDEKAVSKSQQKGLPEMKTFESIRRAMDIAKKSGGDMTGAVKKMNKIKKGVSDNPRVAKALRKSNEELDEVSQDVKVHSTEEKQPTGLIIHMKHKETGKVSKAIFPGTHMAVKNARDHIAKMSKTHTVHKKELQF